MPQAQPMSIVFRFPDVAIRRDELEAALSMPMARFGAARKGPLSFAQINVPEDGDAWARVIALAERLGPGISALVKRGATGQPWADVAMPFPEDGMATSLVIPSTVALVLGRWGFPIEVSAYLTGPD